MEHPLSIDQLPVEVPLYVFCKDRNTFRQFCELHKDRTCIMIEDGETLRGRSPGLIVEHDGCEDNSRAYEIEDSIAIYRPIFNDQLTKQVTDQQDQQLGDYGV